LQHRSRLMKEDDGMTYDEETNYCCTCCHQRAARFSGACHAGKHYPTAQASGGFAERTGSYDFDMLRLIRA
jgi:hypothetical protein